MKIHAAAIFLCGLAGASAQQPTQPLDRSKLPPALRETDLNKLSSGALMMLDVDGSLVRPPRAQPKTQAADAAAQAPVTLDPRVGANIRLGNDPSQLPANQRAQAEPHIIRSPTDLDFLAATFQEGRYTDGGAIDCGYSISHDGGLSWSRALIPGLTQAVGGPYYRATDPVAAINLSGNVYLNTDAAIDSTSNHWVVTVSRSIDSGQTFASPVVAYTPPSSSYFPDKNWMAVNTFPNTSTTGRIVVTFTRFNGNISPIARVFSDDGGNTWSPATLLTPTTSYMQGTQPVFLPGGKLAIVFWNFGGNGKIGGGDDRIEVIVSNDGGTNFGSRTIVTPVPQLHDETPTIRTGEFLPSATGDRTTQSLYVAYTATVNTAPRVMFTKSTNAGANWTAPIAISDNPPNSGVFNPAIAASPDGQTLTAVFYDHRANPGSNTLVDIYMAQSFDSGATWQPNIRVTSVSTDVTLAPYTGSGYMVGDYLGVAEPTNRDVPAVPVFVDTRTGNPDPFVARVGIAPNLTLASWEAARLPYREISDPHFVHSGIQLNISTRALVEPGDDALIGGFIVTGNQPKKILIRGLGPSLSSFGVQGALANPRLELHQGSNTITTNENWKDTQQSDIEATGVAPSNDLESAILRSVNPGQYTAVLRGADNQSGVGLVEVYDLSRTSGSELANISTRGLVATGENVMIGGFIVGAGATTNGSGSAKVVLRALGPSLTQAGVSNALQDPTLELRDANGVLFASDDNWTQSQQAEIQATGLAPSDAREAAIFAVIPPGSYTGIVRGKNGATGVALFEVYDLQ